MIQLLEPYSIDAHSSATFQNLTKWLPETELGEKRRELAYVLFWKI